MTAAAGPAFALPEVKSGAAFGDIDNDGAVDIVVANNNGPARGYLLNENRSLNRNHWLLISLQATQGNRFAMGAKVELRRTQVVSSCSQTPAT